MHSIYHLQNFPVRKKLWLFFHPWNYLISLLLNRNFSVSGMGLIKIDEGGVVVSPYFPFLWSWFYYVTEGVTEEQLLVTRCKQT